MYTKKLFISSRGKQGGGNCAIHIALQHKKKLLWTVLRKSLIAGEGLGE